MLQVFDRNKVQDGAPVILYGAAMYGELAYHALQTLNIPVFSFCDRVQAGKLFCGLNVISPDELRNYPQAHVLVCATKGFSGIVHYLESIGWEHYYEISMLLSALDYKTLPPYCAALPADELIKKYRFYLSEDNAVQTDLSLSFVALSITERCSLRCKKCSVLAPYYKKPCDEALDQIIPPLERFLSCLTCVSELQIGGGEPFMHPGLGELLSWCLKQDKIKEISIFTNSTILPNDTLANILSNPKIKLLLDDYGNLSRRLQDIIQLCDRKKIRYLIQKFERWDDLGDYTDKQETEEQLCEKFRYCSFGNVMSFMKGKLYRCTTAARIADLQMVPDNPTDYVDFSYQQDIENWKSQIRHLISDKKYHLGCKRCNGISTHRLGIPVAEQMGRT